MHAGCYWLWLQHLSEEAWGETSQKNTSRWKKKTYCSLEEKLELLIKVQGRSHKKCKKWSEANFSLLLSLHSLLTIISRPVSVENRSLFLCQPDLANKWSSVRKGEKENSGARLAFFLPLLFLSPLFSLFHFSLSLPLYRWRLQGCARLHSLLVYPASSRCLILSFSPLGEKRCKRGAVQWAGAAQLGFRVREAAKDKGSEWKTSGWAYYTIKPCWSSILALCP